MNIGTENNPLRVAIIGSGPSGFYAAERLQKEADLYVAIDMFDRLPTPFGLVRGGVAPDHPKIKSVTKVYERIASKPGFRFFGNVEFGRDVTRADLIKYYHAIIYSTGAQTDRTMNIPGESLPGSYAATEFVGWYNGHPDFRNYDFELSSARAVAVVGVGNVAMDVARMLGRTREELLETDVADYALEELSASTIETIYIFGRRGPAQAAFTNPEIKELGEMAGTDLVIDPNDLKLDPYSQAYLESDQVDKKDIRNVEIMRELAQKPPTGAKCKIVLRFLVSPVEIIGSEHVEAVKIVHNELYEDERGRIRPRATDKTEIIPVDLVFRSVGYYGVALPDVPFYEAWGIIPNESGRVLTEFGSKTVVTGDYVAGWIKRGPSGVIGTNKPDSVETVENLLHDVRAGRHHMPEYTADDDIITLLNKRGIQYVTFDQWHILDEIEQTRGTEQGRPRVKFYSVDAMLKAIMSSKESEPLNE
jgi:ferredoxin--NADP+ reductase